MVVSICVFAHNEEQLLPSCIGAIPAAAGSLEYEINIIENGSTDETLSVARALAAADTRITLHELSLPDKANAWNEYVFRIAPQKTTHVFIDGDIKPSPGAIEALHHALNENSDAYGAAALPASGRSQREWANVILSNNYISGNLYALSAKTLDIFRQKKIFMPYGAKGEDGLLSYILLTDFNGGADASHRRRIVPVSSATFEFDSLTANSRDVSIFHGRLKRYSERHFQKQILYGMLKKHDLAAMPKAISEIYTQTALAAQKPRLHPLHYFYDRATLRRLNIDAGAFAEPKPQIRG